MALAGKTILITRAAAQSAELRQQLTALGAVVLECPTIEIVPPDDWSSIDGAIRRLHTYDWLLFTSANAVEPFMQRVQIAGASVTTPIAAIGSATARRLNDWKLNVALAPVDFRAEGLLEALPNDLSGKHVLFPRAAVAREILPEELQRRGAQVDVVVVYRTVKAAGLDAALQSLRSTRLDCAVFTSPSTIRFLDEALDGELRAILKDSTIAIIGPVTRQAAEALGLQPTIEPARSTVPDLVEALRRHYHGVD